MLQLANMEKLTIKLTNGSSPLDEVVLVGERVVELSVEDVNDLEKIIDQITELVNSIDGAERTNISCRAFKEDGDLIMMGAFEQGLYTGQVKTSY